METTIFSLICFLAVLAVTNAQYGLPFAGGTCGLDRLMEPSLIRNLKSKYPKKYFSKLGCDKDPILEAKYKLAGKLLARHLKTLNAVGNCNGQNGMCRNAQSLVQQSMVNPQLSSLLSQQQVMPHSQYPCDLLKTLGLSRQACAAQNNFQPMCPLQNAYSVPPQQVMPFQI